MSDDGKSAITIIGFVGSVFSPYYAFARRRGAADPENHVAINVAVYDRHGGWAMTERGRGSLTRDATALVVGPSRMSVAGRTLTIRFDEVRVPLPRRLRGEVRVDLPAAPFAPHALDLFGGHVWQPIAPVARMEVDLEGPDRHWSGDAYVDHNHGDEPLEVGFRSWSWSRVTDGRGTSIVYALQPRHSASRAFRLDVGRDGSSEVLAAPPPVALRRTGWLMPRPAHSDDAGTAKVLRTLEDTPFYARSLVRLGLDGHTAVGVHESLSLDRFRAPIVQAMLPFRMPRRG
ncbi:hypothetical protein [Mongoliimonas terrestris]|uniref:hypothetical protein n=1 Tax=Mongoliimonas terrestris TaxID=1709001 RepID=UPI0009496854|nr:hypothetical protein [Mongoliimonas terrestris]